MSEMSKQPGHLFEFGPFRLDRATRQLWRNSQEILLPPKLFETLSVLVENSGRVMDKDALLTTVWPDSFVEESSLAQNISLLRKVLSEGGDERTYIETIPRRGYRFTADVRLIQPEIDDILINRRTETRIVIEEEDSSDGTATTEAAPGQMHQSVSRANSLLKQFSFRRTRLAIALVVLAVTIAGALGIIQLVKHRTGRVPDFSKMRFTRLTTSGNTPLAALSPDGNYLAYVVADGPLRSLWIRQST